MLTRDEARRIAAIAKLPRGFLPWRLSHAGPGASRIVPMGRHPKPFTKGEVVSLIRSPPSLATRVTVLPNGAIDPPVGD